MREDYLEKRFLSAETLAKREALDLSCLLDWCEVGDLRARQIGNRWFVDLRDWDEQSKRLISDLHLRTNRAIRSPLILLAATLLLFGLISFAPLSTRFRTGGAFIAVTVDTFSNTITDSRTQVEMASVFDLLWIQLAHFWLKVNQFTQTIVSNLNYFGQQAADAWRKFFNQDSVSTSASSAVASTTLLLTLDSAALEALKNEIRVQLLQDLKSGVTGNVSGSSPNAPGLVVLPSSGDSARDEVLKRELKNAFSDRVEVQFDPSGQAGVITPIFPGGRGGNYLFILTPLKQNP